MQSMGLARIVTVCTHNATNHQQAPVGSGRAQLIKVVEEVTGKVTGSQSPIMHAIPTTISQVDWQKICLPPNEGEDRVDLILKANFTVSLLTVSVFRRR